jgi:hypothetical protein
MDVDMDIANIPVSPTSLHSLKFDDNDHSINCDCHANDTYFCGLCYSDVLHQMGQGGKWQQHGDWMQNEQRWVYLCSSCLRFFMWCLCVQRMRMSWRGGESHDYCLELNTTHKCVSTYLADGIF